MILLIVLGIIVLLAILYIIRVACVQSFRMNALNAILKLDIAEAEKFNNVSRDRYKEFNSISFDEMVYKFWIPINKFYKEYDWIKEINNK